MKTFDPRSFVATLVTLLALDVVITTTSFAGGDRYSPRLVGMGRSLSRPRPGPSSDRAGGDGVRRPAFRWCVGGAPAGAADPSASAFHPGPLPGTEPVESCNIRSVPRRPGPGVDSVSAA